MKGKLAVFLSVLSGILLSFPWLVRGTGVVLLVSFIPLLLAEQFLLRQNHTRSSYFSLLPVLSFFTWNLLSVWWIAWVSFWGMMFIVVSNTALQSVVWWSAGYVGRQLGRTAGLFSLICLWLSYEFLVSHWPISWPWLLLGNGFAWSVKLIQWYEYSGVSGGTFWILLSNIFGFSAIMAVGSKRYHSFLKWVAAWAVAGGLPVLLSLFLYRSYEGTPDERVVHMTVIQPNIDPFTEKFGKLNQQQQLTKILDLAARETNGSRQLVISPETSLPTVWEDSIMGLRSEVKPVCDFLAENSNMYFLGGALTKRKFQKGAGLMTSYFRRSEDGASRYSVYNSAILFANNEQPQIYHKNILVNGVERMPFQSLIPFLDRVLLDLGGYSGGLTSGESPAVFTISDSIKIGPVICYESVFGEYIGQIVSKKANLLVVITNDGWWKNSAGVWQHLGYSQIRAVETRRSIARSANTGISGFIDLRGELTMQSSMNEATTISSDVMLNDRLTFYSIYGDYLGRMALYASIFGVIYQNVPRFLGANRTKKIRINSIVKIPNE